MTWEGAIYLTVGLAFAEICYLRAGVRNNLPKISWKDYLKIVFLWFPLAIVAIYQIIRDATR